MRASRSKRRGEAIAEEAPSSGSRKGASSKSETAETEVDPDGDKVKDTDKTRNMGKSKRARKGNVDVTSESESGTQAAAGVVEVVDSVAEVRGKQGQREDQEHVEEVEEWEEGDEEEVEEPQNLAPGRTSELHSPNMLLSGHEGTVYSCAFDPSGKILASGSKDRNIFLWEVFGEECTNYNVLKGHKNAVLDVKWLPGMANASSLVSCSADKMVSLWDADKGSRLRKFVEHGAIVNCCNIDRRNPNVVVSGSDDCTAILWDIRSKNNVSMFHDYQVTAVAITDGGNGVYTGGIDNIIRKWDLRKGGELDQACMTLKGHEDTITGLAVSRDNTMLLSNSMDCSLRAWNIQPFVSGVSSGDVEQGSARYEKLFQGHHHGAEKNLLKCDWSRKMDLVCAGSADRVVHIWDTSTSEVAYKLPGHVGSVNDVCFHPHQNVVASCSTDKTIWLGELS